MKSWEKVEKSGKVGNSGKWEFQQLTFALKTLSEQAVQQRAAMFAESWTGVIVHFELVRILKRVVCFRSRTRERHQIVTTFVHCKLAHWQHTHPRKLNKSDKFSVRSKQNYLGTDSPASSPRPCTNKQPIRLQAIFSTIQGLLIKAAWQHDALALTWLPWV